MSLESDLNDALDILIAKHHVQAFIVSFLDREGDFNLCVSGNTSPAELSKMHLFTGHSLVGTIQKMNDLDFDVDDVGGLQ